MNYYHYSLNFKKEILIKEPDPNNLGFVIAGSLGSLKLYGALFLTNAKFSNAYTAKEYLSLTYAPRFRYQPKLNNLNPSHILDDNKIISQRTCPAFGQHGVGEWVIYTDEYFYPEGGETERWYMGGWDRELLSIIISAYVGVPIFSDELEKAFNEDINKTPGKKSFWESDIPSVLTAKPGGVVAYCPVIKEMIEEYQLLTYLSVSCSYQKLDKGIYIKLWGALWDDFLKLPSQNASSQENSYCDEDFSEIQTKLEDGRPECIHYKFLQNFVDVIKNYDACGIRVCAYPFECAEFFFPDNIKRKKIIHTISEMVNSF